MLMSSSFVVNLRGKVCNAFTPWMLSPSLFQRVRASSAQKGIHHECEVLRSDPEWDFVNSYFFQYAPLNYSIKRIFCVHNPSQTEQFEASLKTMDGEAQNPIFAPKWDKEDPTGCRAQVMARWRESAFSSAVVVRAGSRNEFFSHVFVFPYWHGSNQEKVQSICDTGFAYFGKHNFDKGDKGASTDVGFFGSGIYFTSSARYAADIYSSGHLLLAWVSMRSPYPVIGEQEAQDMPLDKEKLEKGPAFENYDAHYIPVIAVNTSDPMCPAYVPCKKDQIPMWDEAVVFHKSQTLPRFYVELIPTLPTPTSPVITLIQLLEYLQQLSNKPEIAENSQLLSLFQQKKQLLFVMGDSSHLSSVDQKFFDLVRQLQTGAAKLDERVARQFLSPSPLPAPSATQPSLEPPATFLPSPFDIPPMLERSVPNQELLKVLEIRKEALASLGPLFRKMLAWKWIHDPGEGWRIPCLDFDKSASAFLLENGQMVTGDSYAVRVWDPLSGQCLRLFERKLRYPHCYKVLSLGRERLLFPIDDRELVIWDLCTRKVLQCFYPPTDVTCLIEDFILLKNGYVAAVYAKDKGGIFRDTYRNIICLWNASAEGCQKVFEGELPFDDRFHKLFSIGKDYLVITSYSGDLIIWSLNEKKNIFSEKNASVFCLSDEDVVYAKFDARYGYFFHFDYLDSLFVFNPYKFSSGKQRGKPKQLIGHKGSVLCCCRLKDGHVISGSKDKTLKIWDTQSCQCVKTLECKTPVIKIWELKNGLIVSRGEDNTLILWDLQSEKLLQEFSSKDVESIEEIEEGKILVVSETNNTTIFDLAKGVSLCTFPGKGRCLKEGSILCHSGHALQSIDPTSGRVLQTFGSSIISTPTAPYQLPDGKKLVISDNSIFLGERGVFQRVVLWRDQITPLLFLKEGFVLTHISYEYNEYFQVINPKNGEALKTFLYKRAGYEKLIPAPNNKLVALSKEYVDIWDRRCDQIIKSLRLKGGLDPFQLSENVRFLARGEGVQVVLEKPAVDQSFYKILDFSQESDLQWVLENNVHQLQIGIDLREGFLVYENSCLRILDPKTNIFLRSFENMRWVSEVFVLKDNSLATICSSLSSFPTEVIVWDPHTGERLRNIDISISLIGFLRRKEPDFITWFRALEKVVPDNEVSSSRLKIWDSLSETCKLLSLGSGWNSFPFQRLDDGSLVYFPSWKGIEIWNKETNRRLDVLGGESRGVLLLQDGSICKWSEEKPTIRIWNPADGKTIQILHGHQGSVTCAIQLREGLVVSGSKDNTLKVWDLKEGNCLQTLQGHRKPITSVLQLSEDRLLSGSKDATLKVWDLVTGECLKTISCKVPVISLLQLQDGRILSKSKKDYDCYFLQLWDLKGGVPIRRPLIDQEKGLLLRDDYLFDQIRFQDQVLGKETIRLDLWHPFLMPLPFPDLFSSFSPFLNRLEEQIILITAIEKYAILKMTETPVVEVPDKASALQAQAHLHVEKGEFAQALDRYFEALQFTNRSSAYLPIAQIFKEHFPRQAPLAFLQLARAQAKEEDLLGIRETLSSLSGLLKSPELFELLGECALLAKEPKEARAFYEKAMEQYEPRGRKEDIIRGYEKILACDFSNLPLYERLLKLYEEKEKKIALFYMGIFQFRDKDPKRAKALVEQAEKLDPGNPLFSWICNHSYPFDRVV